MVSSQPISQLQLIQCFSVLTNTKKVELVTPDLQSLHWLPVCQKINFKILLLVYRALKSLWLEYISDCLFWMILIINIPHQSRLYYHSHNCRLSSMALEFSGVSELLVTFSLLVVYQNSMGICENAYFRSNPKLSHEIILLLDFCCWLKESGCKICKINAK